MQGDLVETVTVTFGTDGTRVELAAPFVGLGAGLFGLLHLDVFDKSFVTGRVAQTGVVADFQPGVASVQDIVEGLLRQVAHGRLERGAVQFAHGIDLPEYH